MNYIYNNISFLHDTGEEHPESPLRLASFKDLPETSLPNARRWLSLVHTQEYIDEVKEAGKKGHNLEGDTIVSAQSFEAAVAGVSAAILASEQNAFSLMRPPGHHAYSNKGTGFCLFNNIAIAAKKKAEEGNRVVIFDFDGHFGDGTSDIFYNDDSVLYCSIHQSPAFPFKGKVPDLGKGKGKGYNINIPISPGSGDDIFLAATKFILKIIQRFKPDIVAISAGFDAHKSDPLLELDVSSSTFFFIGKMLHSKFSNIFAVLEGGYDVNSLPNNIHNFCAGINNEKMYFVEETTVSPTENWIEFEETRKELCSYLKPFWGEL